MKSIVFVGLVLLSFGCSAKCSNVPVGTIVPSLLDLGDFKTDVGEKDAPFNPKKSCWSPADGRDVAGSKYAAYKASNLTPAQPTVPDVRAMFLRGLNNFDPSKPARNDKYADPQESRIAGDLEEPNIGNHSHNVTAVRLRGGGYGQKTGWSHAETEGGNGTIGSESAGGVWETRPSNIAVYYYIKIN